jgi:hypothetical protein
MRVFAFAAALAASCLTVNVAVAKLPALSDEAKAKAAEAANKTAWSDKVAAYQLCQSMDKVAATYRTRAAATGKAASAPEATPACADPGPYVPTATPAASKPLEASEAHSPPGTAAGPPSNNATSAEMTGPRK